MGFFPPDAQKSSGRRLIRPATPGLGCKIAVRDGNHPGRIAHGKVPGRDGFGYHGSRPHDGPFAHRDAFEHHRAGANEHPAANVNRPGAMPGVVAPAPLAGRLVKVGIHQQRAGADDGAFANVNGSGGAENTAADARVRLQNQFSLRAQGPEDTGLEAAQRIGPEGTVDPYAVSELQPGTFGHTDERTTDKSDAPTERHPFKRASKAQNPENEARPRFSTNPAYSAQPRFGMGASIPDKAGRAKSNCQGELHGLHGGNRIRERPRTYW